MITDRKLRILFVERESSDELRFVVSGMDDEWDVEFGDDAARAMDAMRRDPYDIVLSAPEASLGGDGDRLLQVVKSDFPQSVRIVMTEQDRGDAFLDQVDIAHQQISRPFDLLTLRSVIDRATEIHGIVADPALRYVLADIRSLPTLPSLYLQIVEELDSDDPSIRHVGEIVAGDIGMSTKVLQVANSVLFGARVRISDPIQATVQLGADLVKSLVLMTKVFDQCDAAAIGEKALGELVDHSLRVGARARAICRTERLEREVSDMAFTAGLLHDVGKMILATNLPDTFTAARQIAKERGVPDWLAEKEVFGATHAEIGAYLTGLWGLPEPLFRAILDHHSPLQSCETTFGPLAAIHVADAIDHGHVGGEGEGEGASGGAPAPSGEATDAPEAPVDGGLFYDGTWLEDLGVSGRLDDWSRLGEG